MSSKSCAACFLGNQQVKLLCRGQPVPVRMLILSLAYHVNQLNARQDGLCPTKRFESRHQSYSSFDIPVILLNQIVQILTLPDLNAFIVFPAGVKHSEGCCIRPAFINSHHFRPTGMPNDPVEETQGSSSGIPLRCQQKIDGLA